MTTELGRQKLHRVLASVLIPLARTLLRFGVTYTEFADISKRAFVKAAEADYGVRHRKVSTARVALLTGMSRREVRKLRELLAKRPIESVAATSLPAEVLDLWHTNPSYLDTQGFPRPLPRSGQGSFATIVQALSSDLSPRAVERELLRAGAIRQIGKSRIQPTSREYVPGDPMGKALEGLQLGLRRLTETICHNADPANRRSPYFERVVVADGVDASDAKVVRDGIAGILSNFSETVDDHLTTFTERKKRRNSARESSRTVGVGLFFFDSQSSN
ncbi:MAG: hypothetical protein FJ197_09665 [Gammaproteobacteria bacterium]|nr:hypothetical protein [Gammaproteobacteria bacterium]